MFSNNCNDFRNLHLNSQPLILINIWDAASAAIVQKSGATALATSSASLAWTNGYPDGSNMPIDLLLSSVRSILRVSKVPLTVDIEDGYSDSPGDVAKLVSELVKLGISGINIEDGRNSPDLLVEKISSIRRLVDVEALFINARTDVYLQQLVAPTKMLDETIVRLKRYIAAGADGAFVPAVTLVTDVSTLSSSIQAPLNIMIPNDTEKLEEITKAGANRISLGPASFIDAYSKLPRIVETLLKTDNRIQLSYDSLNNMF